jgi:hypothetical protein
MKLTWKDGFATLLTGAAVAVTLAVTRSWDWPLLGSTRAGIAALGVIGIFGCATAGSANSAETFKGPFVMLAAALGAVAMGPVIFGLIYGTQALLTARCSRRITVSRHEAARIPRAQGREDGESTRGRLPRSG